MNGRCFVMLPLILFTLLLNPELVLSAPPTKKIAVVAKSGGDYSDPLQAMAQVSKWCGTPSETNPCLLKINPGIYDIGSNSLQMLPYVDIEGSGQNVTRILGQIAASEPPSTGVVKLASNAELRFLTVENTTLDSTVVAVAVNCQGSSSSRISDVTATISEGTTGYKYSISVDSCSFLDITNVTAVSTGVGFNNCIWSRLSSLTMTNVNMNASGGGPQGWDIAMRHNGSSVVMANVSATSDGRVMEAVSLGTNVIMKGVTFVGGDTGVFNLGGNAEIHNSVIKGTTNSVSSTGSGKTNIAYSQLVGPILGFPTTLSCIGTYDENFASITCP